MSAFLSVVDSLILIFIIAVKSHFWRVLIFKLIDEFVSIINIFLHLFFFSYLHEFHGWQAFGFIFILIFFVLVLHLFELFFKIHDGLLTIILIIVFFRQIAKNFLIDLIFFELLLPDLVDLIHGFLNGVFVVLTESKEVLNVFIFGIVPQWDTFLDSVFSEFFEVLRFLVGRHCLNLLWLFSEFLSLFDFVVKLALNFGDSSSLYLFVEDHRAVFAGFDQAALCLFGVNFVELFLLGAHNFGLVFHAELREYFVGFGL